MPVNKAGDQESKNRNIPLLVLVGPTAVGKTALAVSVAKKLQTEIISADSAQVYRFLDIGTAKPSEAEKNDAPHHLIDLVEPNRDFSVADYQKEAVKVIEKLWGGGKLPFLVGGTGLYINAVIEGYAFGPKGANREIRDRYEQLASKEGLDKLYYKLKGIDPEAASRIHPNDRRRIIRALEVYELEGRPISEQVTKTARGERGESTYRTLILGLYMDRGALYERIEKRVDLMLAAGWLEETRRLFEQGYRDTDPGMQVLGYRQLLDYLLGRIEWEYMVKEIKKQTRNLAKRQLTWFRRNKDIEWLKITDQTSIDHLTENICFKVKDLAPDRANIY